MNTISKSLKTLVVFLVAVLLGGVAYAWTPPTVAPTGGNAFAPLNTSANTQSKAGSLGVASLTSLGGAVFGSAGGGGIHIKGIQDAPSQGVAIGWNNYGIGSGATWLINNAGWGLGGFNFDNVKNGVQTRLMTLDQNGNLNVQGKVCPGSGPCLGGTVTNSSGNGSITCNADKCVATCAAAPTAPVTLARNETKFCTKTGTVSGSVFGTSGGGATGNLNASINKKNFGWVAGPVNYSVICDFYTSSFYAWGVNNVAMFNCRDNYGTYMPWSTNLYATTGYNSATGAYDICTLTYRNYTTGTAHADADFTNINCTGNKNVPVYTNNTCTGPSTQMHCYEASNTTASHNNVRDNVPLNFGTFPENWTSVNTNF